MGLGYVPYALSALLTFAFSGALFGAAMGALGMTRHTRTGRRGAHPLVVFGAIAIGYPVVSFEMIMYDLRAMGPRGGGGVEVVRDSFGFALLAVAGATCVVARIGLARQTLGAAYAATVASVFALPFVANVSRSIYEAPALMATYAPTALGLVLGASLAWFRRREREALQALGSPAATCGRG